MFRRRRPGAWRIFARLPGGHPRVPPDVAEAERLMNGGRFAAASHRFILLAAEAEQRGMPAAAGEMYLRAARCYSELDDLGRAEASAERALHLLIRARRVGRVRRVLPRVLTALERDGRHGDAERLRCDVQRTLAGMERHLRSTPAATGRTVQLPAKCPSCGAPLKPVEVAWTDAATASCPYCGDMVRAE